MGSFGENLRREREMRGVTLQEISTATKISVRFLKSIENEEFSRLPGGIFNRGFVRSYARYLGLDEDQIVEEYKVAARAKGEPDLTRFSPPKTYSAPKRRFHNSTLVGVIVAVALLAAGYGLWRHSRGTPQPPTAVAQQVPAHSNSPVNGAAPAAAAPSAPGNSASSLANPTDKPADGNKQPAAKPPQNQGVLAADSMASSTPKLPPVKNTDGKLILQVATTERSWVAVDADGKMISQGIMKPNEVKTFRANNSFDVLTGNAQGVILSLDGKTLKSLGRRGEVKQVHLTWKSLQKLPSH